MGSHAHNVMYTEQMIKVCHLPLAAPGSSSGRRGAGPATVVKCGFASLWPADSSGKGTTIRKRILQAVQCLPVMFFNTAPKYPPISKPTALGRSLQTHDPAEYSKEYSQVNQYNEQAPNPDPNAAMVLPFKMLPS